MKDSPGYLVTHSLANSARFKHALFVDAAAASIRSVMDELMKKPESDHVFCYFWYKYALDSIKQARIKW